MNTTNRILSKGKIFDIDQIACMQHAENIRKFVPDEKIEPWHSSSPAEQLLFKVAFISICHQFNWDFLQNRLYEKLLSSGDSLLATIRNISPTLIKLWLNDYPKKERIRAAERAKLIKNVATTIDINFDGDPNKFYLHLSSCTIGNKKFEEAMSAFEAYKRDPLKKKTNILSHEIITENIFKIKDVQNLEPAIDYHIIRLYLRTGRVIAKDKELFKYFKGTPNPRGYLVSQLRQAVGEALKSTAHYANLNVAQVNFIEWQLGRSTCTNENPRCELPANASISSSISNLFNGCCPYSECCLAFTTLKEFIEFEEPLFFSSHY
ncbi:TPA: hypothetical protein SMQ04_001430 [Pseudomonas putida]|nr:hypothetical protein [Pseudomonas putida]